MRLINKGFAKEMIIDVFAFRIFDDYSYQVEKQLNELVEFLKGIKGVKLIDLSILYQLEPYDLPEGLFSLPALQSKFFVFLSSAFAFAIIFGFFIKT